MPNRHIKFWHIHPSVCLTAITLKLGILLSHRPHQAAYQFCCRDLDFQGH